MRRFIFKWKIRKFGKLEYRIVRAYIPRQDKYEYQLECRVPATINTYAGLWENVDCTGDAVKAEIWSDEIGIRISDKPDVIRKS